MPRLADLRDASEAESGGEVTMATGLICMWSGLLAEIPTGWALCDGQGGRPDLREKFIKGAAAQSHATASNKPVYYELAYIIKE